MKNKSPSKILRVFSSLFNIRAWSDWDRMKGLTNYIVEGFKKFFVPQKKVPNESFDTAAKRLNLTEKDLLIRQNGLFRLFLLMILFAFTMLGYSLYNFYYLYLKAGILAVIVMFIALVLAFRYHFWYFQIKERQLGCSVSEWFKQGLMRGKQR